MEISNPPPETQGEDSHYQKEFQENKTKNTNFTITSGRGPISSTRLPRPPRAPLDPRPGRGRLPKLISS